ncbi:hypothetical protein CEXT_225601 [Caerostris extrusa]|uniref:Uncharacterized protein n=1 Tax=Caerostris extrusa TaxID=172846 RepID=A0AAV4PL20_CAEEX|nr:hypothetical protein CEXT_225601 [Caerostris extrusa]
MEDKWELPFMRLVVTRSRFGFSGFKRQNTIRLNSEIGGGLHRSMAEVPSPDLQSYLFQDKCLSNRQEQTKELDASYLRRRAQSFLSLQKRRRATQ